MAMYNKLVIQIFKIWYIFTGLRCLTVKEIHCVFSVCGVFMWEFIFL
jgi:hypothetical protein